MARDNKKQNNANSYKNKVIAQLKAYSGEFAAYSQEVQTLLTTISTQVKEIGSKTKKKTGLSAMLSKSNNDFVKLCGNVLDRFDGFGNAAKNLSKQATEKLQQIAKPLNEFAKNVQQKAISIANYADKFNTTTGKLNLVDDGSFGEGKAFQNAVMQSSARSRTSFDATANMIEGFSSKAGDSFQNNQEIIAFTELLNKMGKLSFLTEDKQSENANIMTEALSSGKIGGNEFKNLISDMPIVMDALEKMTGKSSEELLKLAQQGLISGDMLKSAIFNYGAETNSEFDNMALTWVDRINQIKQGALLAFMPVLEKFNEFANNPQVLKVINIIMLGINMIANWALGFFEFIGNNFAFVIKLVLIFIGILFIVNAALAIMSMISAILSLPLLAVIALIIAIGLFISKIISIFDNNLAQSIQSKLDSMKPPAPQDDYSQYLNGNKQISIGEIGHVGSVGKIDSEVEISEEDIKMLKDVASLEYQLNYTQLTPNMSVNFGDVYETADVEGLISSVFDQAISHNQSRLVVG